jgi:hypothetical protein
MEDVRDPLEEGAEVVVARQVGGLVVDLGRQVVGTGAASRGPYVPAGGGEGGEEVGGDEAGGARHESSAFGHDP